MEEIWLTSWYGESTVIYRVSFICNSARWSFLMLVFIWRHGTAFQKVSSWISCLAKQIAHVTCPRHYCLVISSNMTTSYSYQSSIAILLLMEEILHQLIGSLSQNLQGFIHPRWCRISSFHQQYLPQFWSVMVSLFDVAWQVVEGHVPRIMDVMDIFGICSWWENKKNACFGECTAVCRFKLLKCGFPKLREP